MSAFVHGGHMQLELTVDKVSLKAIQELEAECIRRQDELNILNQQKSELLVRKNASTGAQRRKLTEELAELLEQIETADTNSRQKDDELYQLLHEYGEQQRP